MTPRGSVPIVFRALQGKEVGMDQPKTSRNLPPTKAPVFLVLLWPDETGHWEGRIKDVKTGAEQPFHAIEELMAWLENYKQPYRRLV